MLRHSAAPTAPPAQTAVQYVYYTAPPATSPPVQYYIAAPPGQPPVPAQQPQYYVVQQPKQDSALKKLWKAMKPKSSDRWFVKVLKGAGIVLAGAVVFYVAMLGLMLICCYLGAEATDERKYPKPPSLIDQLYGRA